MTIHPSLTEPINAERRRALLAEADQARTARLLTGNTPGLLRVLLALRAALRTRPARRRAATASPAVAARRPITT